MGQVGNALHELAEFGVDGLDYLVAIGNAGFQLAHAVLAVARVGAFAPQLADFGALGIHLGLELFGFGDGGPAPPIELAKPVEAGNRCPGRQARGDLIEMASEIAEIEHVPLC